MVVMTPRTDARAARSLEEHEPNDSPEQAQLIALNPDWPVMEVQGSLSRQGESNGKDIDMFKLLVDDAGPNRAIASRDSAQPADPRSTARRLMLEIAPEAGASVSLQLLDDGLKVLESVSAENGEVAGMPNMAVQPGHGYYFRVKALAKSGKSVEMQPACKYKLSVQLGDFEVADEREPNDSMETAAPVVMTGLAELAGLHGWQHDQDFYRLPAPEVASALDVVLDGVEGVTQGLQVLAGNGARLAVARGRKGERLALHNVRIGGAVVDAGAASQSFYVVVRSEAGQNRGQRYILHVMLGAQKQDAEIEPNDTPTSATPVADGATSAFLPSGDVDYFIYLSSGESRDVSVEVSFPTHVRGKVEVLRPGSAEIIASAESKRPRQEVGLAQLPTLGQPLLFRISPARGDGNANDPYLVRISSTPTAR